MPCNHDAPCYGVNTRDFDLLGYKYGLLSTVGTAGQNNVVTMIPARDVAEFELFPEADPGLGPGRRDGIPEASYGVRGWRSEIRVIR